ncbi:MAG: hypothetical protein K2G03_05135, partial [Bacilli bacterium]|nr:hypothetical protein [Bacilli bacterium]
MGKVRIPDSNPNEQYLEQLLNPVQSGEGSTSLGEEELQRNTYYRHVPSYEEIRLAKLEQSLGSFSEQDQDKKDLLPSVIGDKSIPIEQGAAEKYLESLPQGAEERKEFVGFNLDELITEDKDAEALNPDSVFGEVTGDVERSEEGKSPAARKIEEMLQALNERQRNRDISNAQGGSEPVHKKSEMEIAMDEMLASVMDVPKRGEFTGFNENMLGESLNEKVNTAAGLLGLSSENSYNKYTPVPRTKSAEEERYDAMLRGEYREPPAVVIPDFIPSNVQKAEMSQGERYLEEQLANLANPKKLQAVTDVVEEEKRPVYVKEKSPEEEALDRLMEDALQPKDPILPKGSIIESMTGSEKEVSEISGKESYLNNLLNMAEKENNSMGSDEFKGFDDLLSERPYLEAASSPQDLLAPVIRGVESAEEGNRELDEKESYLDALLNGVLNPSPNNKTEEDSVRRLPPYVREPSEEELRLREVERQALLPKKPLIEEEQEKDEVGVSVGEQKESAGESYLSQLLDNMDKPDEEKEFTGFSEDMSGDNSLEYVGPQGLIESSLDEKIRQVEAMEKAKKPEEKRLDAMLRGNEEGPSGTPFEEGFIGFN